MDIVTKHMKSGKYKYDYNQDEKTFNYLGLEFDAKKKITQKLEKMILRTQELNQHYQN